MYKCREIFLANKRGGDIFANKRGGDVFTNKRGGDIFANKRGGDVFTNKCRGDIFATDVERIFSLTSVEGIFSPSCTGIQAGRWVNRRLDNRHNVGYQVPDRLKHISRCPQNLTP